MHINMNYLLAQLAHASDAKAPAWRTALRNIAQGVVNVGSRVPVAGTPAWVTLQVLHGGFASGRFAAGGELQAHEHALAEQLGVKATRSALNDAFLGDEGLALLRQWIAEGTYAVDVPEEAALLTVVSLVDLGDATGAAALLRTLSPWMDRLRFYPRPTTASQPAVGLVSRFTAADTIVRLSARRPQKRVVAMNETLGVWKPLQAEIVALFLETVEGDVPRLVTEDGVRTAVGGWPLRQLPEDWTRRARALLERYATLRHTHRAGGRPVSSKSTLGRLLHALTEAASTTLTDAALSRLRWTLAGHITKHGVPEEARAQLEADIAIASRPLFVDLVPVLVDRLRTISSGQGIEQLERMLADVSLEEAEAHDVSGAIPAPLAKTIAAARLGTLEELVDAGVISSAEVLATLTPQITGAVHANSLPTPELRALFAATYRAFRRRRSLLLLDLQSQVRITELPWIQALQPHRDSTIDDRSMATQVARRITTLAMTTWPHVQLPNPFVSELQPLLNRAGLDLPLVEEIAADIFMGRFSPKFTHVAQRAAKVLEGTTYARYYRLDLDAVRALSPKRGLMELSRVVTGAPSGWGIAQNGMVLEGVAVLTTHNLATLTTTLDLELDYEDLATRSAVAVESILAERQHEFRAQLRRVKNAAYAWRQMVFWLSMLPLERQQAFAEQGLAACRRLDPELRKVLTGAWRGLRHATQGRPVSQPFLGWSTDHRIARTLIRPTQMAS